MENQSNNIAILQVSILKLKLNFSNKSSILYLIFRFYRSANQKYLIITYVLSTFLPNTTNIEIEVRLWNQPEIKIWNYIAFKGQRNVNMINSVEITDKNLLIYYNSSIDVIPMIQ